MTAVGLSCFSALLFGAMIVALQRGGRRQPSAGLGALSIVIVGLVIVALVAVVEDRSGAVTIDVLWPLLLSGALVPGMSHILFVQAINDAGPSRAAIVASSAPLLSVALSVTVLHERFEPLAGLGAILIVGGGALLAWERDRPADFRTIGLVLAALAALLFAIRDNLVRSSTHGAHLDVAVSTIVILASALPVILLYLALTSRPRIADVGAALRAYLPAGAFFGGAYVTLVAAFHHGRVAVVSPLNSTQSLWVLGLSVLLLGQTERLGRRTLGAGVLVVVGAAIIGMTR